MEPEYFANEGTMFLRSVGNHLASDTLPRLTTPESKDVDNIADFQLSTKGPEHVTNDLPPASTAIIGGVSPVVPLQILTASCLDAESSPLLHSK
jgi:hypothetical protein